MSENHTARETTLQSLLAIGSDREAAFYTQLFQSQDPERFALLVADPRILRSPLLKSFVSNLKILSQLQLTPVVLLGVLEDERSKSGSRTSVKFQGQRLVKELEGAGVLHLKLNCATYELVEAVRENAREGRITLLEYANGGLGLAELAAQIQPEKVIFLQPSGGLRRDGARVPVVNLDDLDAAISADQLSSGQKRFLAIVEQLSAQSQAHCTYVMASPLNLLTELFTLKGAGTLMRRGCRISAAGDYQNIDMAELRASISSAFGKSVKDSFFDRSPSAVLLEEKMRAGAILLPLGGLPYLSKFWVRPEAQGDGIARDVWQALCAHVPAFFWRARADNPFATWYTQRCDGMQKEGEWRIFWKGLNPPEIPGAILAAAGAPKDFDYVRERS